MERADPAWRSRSAKALSHDGLAGGVNGKAEVADHGGDQGATHDAAGNEGKKSGPERRQAQPAAGGRPWWPATK